MASQDTSKTSYGSIQPSQILPQRRPSTIIHRSLPVVSTISDKLLTSGIVLPNIIFKEGNEELRAFPSELRVQLQAHVKNHGVSLLWGVACKDLNKPLWDVNGAASHFRTVNGRKLFAAKYRYGDLSDITAVKDVSEGSFNNGKAALLTYNVTCRQTVLNGIKYRRVMYNVWQSNSDATVDPTAQQVHRYIEVKQDSSRASKDSSDEVFLGHENNDSESRKRRRPQELTLPLDFTKVEGNNATAFPTYLSQDIAQFIRGSSALPSCARRKDNGRGLFSKEGKLVQYRDSETQEILLADRFECQGRWFDIVHATSSSTCLGGKSALIGGAANNRGGFSLEDGTRVCVSYYYVWSSLEEAKTPQIEKWTFQSELKDTDNAMRQHPKRLASSSSRLKMKSSNSHLSINANANGSGPRIVKETRSTMALSTESSVLSIRDNFDERTDDSEDEDITLNRYRASPILHTRHHRSLSTSSSPANLKRRRGNGSDNWDQPIDKNMPLRQGRVYLRGSRDSFKNNSSDQQPDGYAQSLSLVKNGPLSTSANPANLASEASEMTRPELEFGPDHFFVFKMNVVDQDEYPPKSFRICSEIALLFQHAIQAGIADKHTTLLSLQSRKQQWSVVRGDPHEFEKVMAWLSEARTAQRVVVTPDMD